MQQSRGVVRNFNPWVPNFYTPQAFSGFQLLSRILIPLSFKIRGFQQHFPEIRGFHGTYGTHANYGPECIQLFFLFPFVIFVLTQNIRLISKIQSQDGHKNRFHDSRRLSRMKIIWVERVFHPGWKTIVGGPTLHNSVEQRHFLPS